MCGIAGWVNLSPDAEGGDGQPGLTRQMTSRLIHRGPDGEGHWLQGACGLGHRRLKIIDLTESAAQPMWDSTGQIAVTFNGEIYNFVDLRDQLKDKHEFRTASDTEVIVNGYREWGTDVVRRLNGMFAFALWDHKERVLLLGRDRLGKKPLFYHRRGNICVFASTLTALRAHPAVPKAIDSQSVAQYLAFGYVPTPRSILKDVHKLTQGSYLQMSAAGAREVAYWNLEATSEPRSEADALDELDSLLRDSVRIRLQSDVPLTFFLSGGVDSSLVTAIGQQLRPEVSAVAVGFGRPDYDETASAARIAAHLQVDFTTRRVEDGVLSENLSRIPTILDEPLADSSLLVTFAVSQAARQLATVALSGDGGDELFCGYPKYRNLRDGLQLLRLPQVVRESAAAVASRMPWDVMAKSAAATTSRSPAELMRWLVSVWKPEELKQLMPDVSVAWEETQFQRTVDAFSGREPVEALMAADIRTYLCDDILQKVDRASMAVSLESRAPLLDYRIVEFAMRLPLSLKWRGGEQKYLLKRLLERYVPRPLWDRPKHGFQAPMKELYRATTPDYWRRHLDVIHSAFPWMCRSVSERMIADHLKGRRDYSQKLYSLDVLARWSAAQ